MKKSQSNKMLESSSFFVGYEKGKEKVKKEILNFVDKESEFLPDIHSDALLDRLVKLVKNL